MIYLRNLPLTDWSNKGFQTTPDYMRMHLYGYKIPRRVPTSVLLPLLALHERNTSEDNSSGHIFRSS